MTYQQHPLSAAFPAMSDAEFQGLEDSISDLGVQNAITLYEGMVLDGWNRYRAATGLGLECPTAEFDGDDPVRFVRAQNRHRRHLTASAWALIEVSLSEWKPSHRPDKGEVTSPLRSNAEMAASAGVTVRTIQQAKVVATSGSEEVQKAVKAGAVSVEKAAEIARLPQEQQAAALAAPKPAKFKGKPKKVPAAKLFAAEIKAVEAKKVAEGAEERVAGFEIEIAALRDQLIEANEDNAALAKVIAASDELAEALADAKAARALARRLQQRIDSMLTEIAELNRSVKIWQKKAGVSA